MVKKISLFLVAIFVMNAVMAAPADDLTNLLNSVHTMKSEFIQTVYDNRGKAIQTSKGQMALDRPGKFRWEVKKPIPQLIIANATKLWIYDADLDQVTIRTLKQAAGDTPALLLSHVGTTLGTDYTVKPITQKPANLNWFSLIPKNQDNMFASIEMGFNQNDINEMRLEDHLGHTTAIQFTHMQTNVNLPATLFAFKAPKGVDIIDETRH